MKPGFLKIAEIDVHVAEEVIDSGVNAGQSRAGLWFQQALNVLNRRGSDYADIGEDGKIGNASIGAFQALRRRRGELAARGLMLKALNGLQFWRTIIRWRRTARNSRISWSAGRRAHRGDRLMFSLLSLTALGPLAAFALASVLTKGKTLHWLLDFIEWLFDRPVRARPVPGNRCRCRLDPRRSIDSARDKWRTAAEQERDAHEETKACVSAAAAGRRRSSRIQPRRRRSEMAGAISGGSPCE